MEGTDDMNMNISTDSEINVRLIDLSRIVSSMLETAETPKRYRLPARRNASYGGRKRRGCSSADHAITKFELARGKARIGPT